MVPFSLEVDSAQLLALHVVYCIPYGIQTMDGEGVGLGLAGGRSKNIPGRNCCLLQGNCGEKEVDRWLFE